MRKAIWDFVCFENTPGLEKIDTLRDNFLFAAFEIYHNGLANEATLCYDINALVAEYRTHEDAIIHYGKICDNTFDKLRKDSKYSNIDKANLHEYVKEELFNLYESKGLQTISDHIVALEDINIFIVTLLFEAKEIGIVLPESELKKYDSIEATGTNLGQHFRKLYSMIGTEKTADNTIISNNTIGNFIDLKPASKVNENQEEPMESEIKDEPIWQNYQIFKLEKPLANMETIYNWLSQKNFFLDKDSFGYNEFIKTIQRAYFGLDIYINKTTATHLLSYFSNFFEEPRKYKEIGAKYIKANPNKLINGNTNSPIKRLLKEIKKLSASNHS